VLISWKIHWNLIKKEHICIKMKIESHWNQNKNLKNINRLQFFTFIQMKLDYNYFKFYLNKLFNYDSDKCHLLCHQRQTSEHLLTTYYYFKNEQLVLRRKLKDLLLRIRILFILKEKNLSCFTVSERNKSRNQKVVVRREGEERDWLNWKKS